MPTGTVKWFDETKGFGYIKRNGVVKDVFVHINDVRRSGLAVPREGQVLSFEIGGKPDKPCAFKLKEAGDPAESASINACRMSRIDNVVTGRREEGTVATFNNNRGYGFIRPDSGARDVLVHVRFVKQAGRMSLREGERVSFIVNENTRQAGKYEATELQFLA